MNTSLRCIRCGHLLTSSLDGTEAYRKSAKKLDTYLYGKVAGTAGGALGFALHRFVLPEMGVDRQWSSMLWFVLGAAGFALGQYIAKKKYLD
ncbi:hypothetical protein [Paracidovorax konjaci]|uniref:hypothetical protein n=1 Tax=Paracidovorax konjaci TaxID=32040 RepID=UPI001113EE71|nr:hypothetical protein [Paracidovorax konjaci]